MPKIASPDSAKRRRRWLAAGVVSALFLSFVLLRANSRLLWTMADLGLATPVIFSPAGNLVVSRETGIEEIDSHGRFLRTITDDPDIQPVLGAGSIGFYGYVPPTSEWGYGLVDWDGSTRWTLGEDARPNGPAACGADGTLFSYGTGSNLFVYRPDGTLSWKRIGISTTINPPAVALDGSVVVCSVDPVGLLLLEADGSERWRKGMSIAILPALARDARGGVYVGGRELICYDSAGNEKWRTANPFNAPLNGLGPPAVPTESGFIRLSVSPRGWVYAASVDGVIHVFDERGRHQWLFKEGFTNGGSDWIAFTDSGNALLCTSEFEPLNVPGGPLTKLGIGGVETNRRLVCLSPAGKVLWEQSLPGWIDLTLPRSRAELYEAWQRRFGLRDSQRLRGPVIGPDGTIYVLGATLRSLNKLYAIRSDEMER